VRGCRRALPRIERAADGSLSLEERFQLEEHVAGCPRCAKRYEEALAIEEALLALPEPPLLRLDVEAAVRGVRSALDAGEAVEPVAPRPTRPVVERRVAAAVVVLALGGAGLLLWSEGPFGRDAGEPHEAGGARVATLTEPDSIAPPPPDPDAVDPARLAAARADLRRALAATLGGTEPPAAGALERFDELTAELREADWPLARMAEASLTADDPEIRRGALRFLGARGDRLSAGRVLSAAFEAEYAPVALGALAEMGEPGLDALMIAVREPALSRPALAHLEAVGGAAVVRRLAAEVDRETESGTRGELLGALSRTGPEAVPALLAIAEGTAEDSAERAQVFDALRRVEVGGRELTKLLGNPRAARRGGSQRQAVLLEAVRVLQPVGALDYLVELASGSRYQEEALYVLGNYSGPDAVEALVRLHSRDRTPPGLVAEAASTLFRDDPFAAADCARRLIHAGRTSDASKLLELLLLSEGRGLGEALVELALFEELDSEERQWAALAVGELGTPADAQLLAAALARMSRADRRLAASILIVLHRVVGADAVFEALAPLGERQRERVLRVVEQSASRGDVAVPLFKLARELDPWFAARNPKPWRSSS
jgi:hypothetical protein